MRVKKKQNIGCFKGAAWLLVLIMLCYPLPVMAQENGQPDEKPEESESIRYTKETAGQDSFSSKDDSAQQKDPGETGEGFLENEPRDPDTDGKDPDSQESVDNGKGTEGEPSRKSPNKNNSKGSTGGKKESPSNKRGKITLKGCKKNQLLLTDGQKKRLRVNWTGIAEEKTDSADKSGNIASDTEKVSESLVEDANWRYQLSGTDSVILQKIKAKKNGKEAAGVYLKAVKAGKAVLTISARENGRYEVRPLEIQIAVRQAEKILDKEALPAPKIRDWKRSSDSEMLLSWEQSKSADSYQIECSASRTFADAKSISIKDNRTTKKAIQGLKKDHPYYARIRACKTSGEKVYYSKWSVADNIKESAKAQIEQSEEQGDVLGLQECLGEETGLYDTSHGSCTDGIYAYYLMFSQTTGDCRILKVLLETREREALSESLDIQAGSDMTYDSEKEQLVLCGRDADMETQLIYIDPDTLQIESRKTVHIPMHLDGGQNTDEKAPSGFNGIAYSESRREYVAMLEESHHLLILDDEMEPVKLVKTSKDNSYQFQGIDATDDYILTCMSPGNGKQKYSMIMVYDWDGNQISAIHIKNQYTLESIYHVGSQFYATFNCERYQSVFQTVKKKVHVDGHDVMKKVKRKVRVLQKDNFVYPLDF